MKKVLFVATVVKTHIMEFHVPYLKMFKEMGWETAVAARNDYENPTDCEIPYCDTYYDIPFERNPFKFGNLNAYRILKRIIDKGDYDIIHCHTPVGAMIARLAASDARKKGSKVFYTAHGFHFYKGAPMINWLLYYPAERMLARKTDVLITINKEDYDRAKHFRAGRVEYVPGVGIDVKRFAHVKINRAEKQRELGIPEDAVLLLTVGELINRKNHAVAIRALEKLKSSDIHYAIVGRGSMEKALQSLTDCLNLNDRVHFLGYRYDIAEICKAADVFVFPSRQEGLPVAIMEAMASGLPIIAAKIRGVTDLLEGSENLLIDDCNDVEAFAHAIDMLASKQLRERIGSENYEMSKEYDIASIQKRMCTIYGIE